MNSDFSNVSYLISDWDGTIVDSMPAKTEAFTKIVSDKFSIDPMALRKFYNDTASMSLNSQI
jgi:beta-phosphoglucomutase-like phosphatase (HAD superfamily)